MSEVHCGSLGEAWISLVSHTLKIGVPMGKEGFEVLGMQVRFPAVVNGDPILKQFGDPDMVAAMDCVFFTNAPNVLGHSYSRLMVGPAGRSDLEDIIALLRSEPLTKRAVLTLCGEGNGKVPCINVVQFLIRAGEVHLLYFARGQDVFRKFYADGICLAKMARHVSEALRMPAGFVTGFLGSSHLYHSDRAAIDYLLEQACAHLPARGQR